MAEKSGWIWISVGLLCGLIAASTIAAYYYGEYTKYQDLYKDTLQDLEALTMQVSILIDYGNGSREWHNNTRVPIGVSLLNATRMVAEVNYTVYPELGAFVNAINNVGGDLGRYWLWCYWSLPIPVTVLPPASPWAIGPSASDAYILHHGDILSWIYE